MEMDLIVATTTVITIKHNNNSGNHSFELRERKSHVDHEFPELSTKKPE